jgi:hypothetical protein
MKCFIESSRTQVTGPRNDMRATVNPGIEVLQPRIAPASVSVTYKDVDGDLVKITASRPGSAPLGLSGSNLFLLGSETEGQLRELALFDSNLDGASIIFTVTKKAGGDGLAHVGFINAFGVDLDRVVVKGDLGRIVAGDESSTNDPGLNLLSVRSMGTLGLLTQNNGGNLASVIHGKLGALKVARDFVGAFLTTNALVFTDAAIGSVTIGGNLIGVTGSDSGRIHSDGAIGPVRIGGDVVGGTGDNSGQIFSEAGMGDVRVGGDIVGGVGGKSGGIQSEDSMGKVRIGGSLIGGVGIGSGQVSGLGKMSGVVIGGDVVGGAGADSGTVFGVSRNAEVAAINIGRNVQGGTGAGSGSIFTEGVLGNVRIAGDLIGGSGEQSGVVRSEISIGNVIIGGNLIGGSITGTVSLRGTGEILSLGRIASVTIAGSVMAGFDDSTGTLIRSGSIVAGDDIGPVKIGGSILGNSTNPALIIGQNQEVKPASGFDTAIASVTVGKDVRFARILAGFNSTQGSVNADASIGAVSVGGDWQASSLVAGAQDAGTPGFGVGDTLQTVDDTALIARIASISIRGQVIGSVAAGDHFGFVAEEIGRMTIAGRPVALTPGAGNDTTGIAIPFTNDVAILEVASL